MNIQCLNCEHFVNKFRVLKPIHMVGYRVKEKFCFPSQKVKFFIFAVVPKIATIGGLVAHLCELSDNSVIGGMFSELSDKSNGCSCVALTIPTIQPKK